MAILRGIEGKEYDINPREMGERLTDLGAEGMLSEARAAFGIKFDDMSSVDIYKVYIGPPPETMFGFLSTTSGFQYGLRAEQTSWVEEIEKGVSEWAEATEDWDDFMDIRAALNPADVMETSSGTAYGDSPHLTDTYEDFTEFVEDPDGYEVAQFASILQYASLYNWASWEGPDIDDNVAMANNTIHVITAMNESPGMNRAPILPEISGEADDGLDIASMDYNGEFLGVGDAGATYVEALQQKWKTREITIAEMEAFITQQAAAVADTVTVSVDTMLTANRQRTAPLPPSALTTLHAGSKTRPTSTFLKEGYDWLGILEDSG